jgi:hypothetical protein
MGLFVQKLSFQPDLAGEDTVGEGIEQIAFLYHRP